MRTFTILTLTTGIVLAAGVTSYSIQKNKPLAIGAITKTLVTPESTPQTISENLSSQQTNTPTTDPSCNKQKRYIVVNKQTMNFFLCNNAELVANYKLIAIGPEKTIDATPKSSPTGFKILSLNTDAYMLTAGGNNYSLFKTIARSKKVKDPLVVPSGVFPEYEKQTVVNAAKVGAKYTDAKGVEHIVPEVKSSIFEKGNYVKQNVVIEFLKKKTGRASSCAIHDDIMGKGNSTLCCPTISKIDAAKLKELIKQGKITLGDKIYIQ
jgi:hypothetical protein